MEMVQKVVEKVEKVHKVTQLTDLRPAGAQLVGPRRQWRAKDELWRPNFQRVASLFQSLDEELFQSVASFVAIWPVCRAAEPTVGRIGAKLVSSKLVISNNLFQPVGPLSKLSFQLGAIVCLTH